MALLLWLLLLLLLRLLLLLGPVMLRLLLRLLMLLRFSSEVLLPKVPRSLPRQLSSMPADGQDDGAPSSEHNAVGVGDPFSPKSLSELNWPMLLHPPLWSLRSAWPLPFVGLLCMIPPVDAIMVGGGLNSRRPPSLKPRTMSPVLGSRKDAQCAPSWRFFRTPPSVPSPSPSPSLLLLAQRS